MDLYQQNILDHYKKPKHQGELSQASHSGLMANPLCGDRIDIHLLIKDDVVIQVKWQGEGCVLSMAAADILAELLLGKSVSDLKKIKQTSLITALGIKPSPSREKCALLSFEALKKALTN